ncbi:hypothetical protein [Dongia sp.]|uniref:hypothetical protein n=1 Tax=Dongia sp. TaxID=1977262 RepID=UPI0035B39CA1
MADRTSKLFRSFAGGVISPEMFGRLDLDKFQTGVARADNFLILPHGPAQNRAGSKFVNEAKDSTKKVRVIRFNYSRAQTACIELGGGAIRFHTNGATLLETGQAITSISQANPGVVNKVAHGYSNDEWVYLYNFVGMPELGGRFFRVSGATADSLTLQDMAGNLLDTSALAAFVSGTMARVYTLASPYLESELFDITYTQDKDVITLAHPNHPVRELRRLGAASWQLVEATWAPSLAQPASAAAAVKTGSGAVAYEYAVTAVDATGVDESYPRTAVVASFSITGITKANPGVISTSVVHGLPVGARVQIVNIGGMTQIPDGIYKVNTVPTTSSLSLKRITDDTVVDTTSFSTWTAGGEVRSIEVSNNLSTAGNANKITWPAVTKAARYNVYKLRNGLYGYIGQTTLLEFIDDNIAADVLRTPPEPGLANPFPAPGDYPAAVGYYAQRRVLGGTNNRPQNGWMTKPGTESNLTASVPAQDDDSISFRIVSGENNTIKHIVALTDLLLLTEDVEWRLVTQNSDALTPSTFEVKAQSYVGCNNVRPILTSRSVLFIQQSGTRMREMSYDWEVNQYSANDISLMAPQLFDGYTIVDMAFQKAPYPIAWCVRSDGALLGLTYVPEHKVAAWHLHVTVNGAFESVCTVPEGTEDAVYVVVRRTIQGRTVRNIERFSTRRFATLADSFFVDCGVSYVGTPKTTFYVPHLEGQEVDILADGGVVGRQTVTNGKIELGVPAGKVHVGLPIKAVLETLPLTLEQFPAFGTGMMKTNGKLALRVKDSSNIRAGQKIDKLTTFNQRSTENYDTAPALKDGIASIHPPAGWSYDAPIFVVQDQPLPVTIVALTTVAAGA